MIANTTFDYFEKRYGFHVFKKFAFYCLIHQKSLCLEIYNLSEAILSTFVSSLKSYKLVQVRKKNRLTFFSPTQRIFFEWNIKLLFSSFFHKECSKINSWLCNVQFCRKCVNKTFVSWFVLILEGFSNS